MAKKMLIDATHAEETRVVVVDGNKVEEFDFESENKRQLAGNIYLAKVTRVEPSLQAAFIDYGGNRHGFLAFSEIHPDYYQIPVADREALLKEELEYAKQQEEEEDREKPKRSRRRRSSSSSSSRGRSASVAADASNDDAVETKEVAPASDDLSGEAPAGVKGMDVVEPEASEADALIADTHEPVEEGTSPAFAVAETPVEEPSEDEPPTMTRPKTSLTKTSLTMIRTTMIRTTSPLMTGPRATRTTMRKPQRRKTTASKALPTMTPPKRSAACASRVPAATKSRKS